MTLFIDTQTKLLCHMSPINITMESYMQILQKMFKINNYLWTYMQVLQWMLKKSITKLICGYCNKCKRNQKLDLYVGIAYLKWPYGNYNKKDVGITQCSF